MILFRSVEQRACRIPDPVEKLRYLRGQAQGRPNPRGRLLHTVIAALPLLWPAAVVNPNAIVIPRTPEPAASAPAAPAVWLVEQANARTVYSNGLVVRDEFSTRSEPRRYRPYSLPNLAPLAPETQPRGIVFHSTESLILPLEPSHNRGLVRTREALLNHVRRGKLYNFVIDRFGQVYRVVPEDQTAFHAGHSAWAEGSTAWVDLNAVFLGVSFEAETDRSFEASPAQIHAGRLLTEMLRSRYEIPDANCVTHAQVSVNPDNMRIGYHTDWAARFPFAETGLETGYAAPVAAVSIFGFQWDGHFLQLIGGQPWPGLIRAEEELARQADQRGMTLAAYRIFQQNQYRQLRRRQHERSR